MQLFVLTPVLAYALYKFRAKALSIIVILMGVSMGSTVYLFVKYDFVAQFANPKWVLESYEKFYFSCTSFLAPYILSTFSNGFLKQMELTYYPTHIRMSPWLVGIVCAYIIFRLRDKRINMNKVCYIHFLMRYLASNFDIFNFFSDCYMYLLVGHTRNYWCRFIFLVHSTKCW